MTLLIKHPFFRTVLIAACMLSVDTPGTIPKLNTDRTSETTPKGMKVAGTPTTRRRKSAKPKRSHSKTIVDSGASVHCIRDRSLFTSLDTSKHVSLKVADNRTIYSEGVGTCAVKIKAADGQYHDLILHNCLYSSHFSENLISTRRLWLDNKLSTHLGESSYFKCHYTKHRYYFSRDCTSDIRPAARRMESNIDLNVIHARSLITVLSTACVNYSMLLMA